MTDARHYLRWTAPNSDASHTLREVMRHEQRAVPSPERLAAMIANARRAALQGTAAPQLATIITRTLPARLTSMLGTVAIAGAMLLQLSPLQPLAHPAAVPARHTTLELPSAAASSAGTLHVDTAAAVSVSASSQPALRPPQQPPIATRTPSVARAAGTDSRPVSRRATQRPSPPAARAAGTDFRPVSRRATQRPSPPAAQTPAAGASLAQELPRANMAGELSLLLAARRALVVPADALTLLDQHAREFPRSRFEEEREALAIEALAGVGEHQEANSRARRFFATFSGSAYRRRLEAVLAVP